MYVMVGEWILSQMFEMLLSIGICVIYKGLIGLMYSGCFFLGPNAGN